MFKAHRKRDAQIVEAFFERKSNGPFYCLDCGDEVTLKCGRNKINHFAHVIPKACRFDAGESDEHRRCKLEILEALRKAPEVLSAELERSFGPIRPDIFAVINGVPVGIEVQLSSLSVETIMRRTIEYHRHGVYVLWLLQWTPALDTDRYTPKIWEKWVHAAYFGRVYYWLRDKTIVSYCFEPKLKHVPRATLFGPRGKKITVGGYMERSKRFRVPVKEATLDLVKDFGPKQRYWWGEKGIVVPDAKLFTHQADLPKSPSC